MSLFVVRITCCAGLRCWTRTAYAVDITSGPLFPKWIGDRFQRDSRLTSSSYAETLKYIGVQSEINGTLSLHSGRRGGAQYACHVLNWSYLVPLRECDWESEAEMLNYLGFSDRSNGYVKLRFSDL